MADDDDPLNDLLERIAALRASVAAERRELARLDLGRLARLELEAVGLTTAWEHMERNLESGADRQIGWATAQFHADRARLRRAETDHHERAVACSEHLRELERWLREPAPSPRADEVVVPLRR